MLSTPRCSPQLVSARSLENSYHQTAILYTLNASRHVKTIHESTSEPSKKHYNQDDQRSRMNRKPSGEHILQLLTTAEPGSYTSPTHNSTRISRLTPETQISPVSSRSGRCPKPRRPKRKASSRASWLALRQENPRTRPARSGVVSWRTHPSSAWPWPSARSP
jgi:hypothetical protein